MTDDMQEKAAALTGRVCAEFLQHGELNVSAMNAAIETALREAHAAGIRDAFVAIEKKLKPLSCICLLEAESAILALIPKDGQR